MVAEVPRMSRHSNSQVARVAGSARGVSSHQAMEQQGKFIELVARSNW